ncbi:MAG: glycerol-3-phosphate dehydrogenase, partial [Pseudorhodoplanes sp.]
LTAAEVRYLMEREWALDANDILWRRSKLGLKFSGDERAKLERFMAQPRGLNAAE